MKIAGKPYRTIWPHEDGSVQIIDQTKLPHAFVTLRLKSADDAAHAIKAMIVRGAPLIGATAAYGIALAMREDSSDVALDETYDMLLATRPTAINLRWALMRMRDKLRNRPREERAKLAWAEAAAICDEDVETCRSIGEHGLAILREAAKKKAGRTLNILTHCNAGWLACVDWGTALAPIYMAHDAGIPLHVWVDETRPRNQGASLTAFELGGHGVKHTIIADNAGGHYMQAGEVDLCIVGTDRVTSNGDVANKIGTYLKALAAKDNGVPFYVALPSSTIDWTLGRWPRHSHRGTLLRRAAENDGALARRRPCNRGNRGTRQPRRQSRLRCDTGAPRHRFHHRKRDLRRDARGAFVPFSRAQIAGQDMKSRWSDAEAREFVTRYEPKGVNEDLALRVYTTRLLGSDPRLVLHGGGNTSVKTQMTDFLGDTVEVICIKGSGWDMGKIEPAGLPAVRLAPLRRLRALDKLSDEDMVNFQRINLLDSNAPNPSVETLLHAFLPHKFIDHTHSTAVLAMTDQPDGEALAREIFGDRVAYVPYTIPGFALAKSVADVFARHPQAEGLVLLQHGIFTFAETAQDAYESMIRS